MKKKKKKQFWPKIQAKQESDLTAVQLKQNPSVFDYLIAYISLFMLFYSKIILKNNYVCIYIRGT